MLHLMDQHKKAALSRQPTTLLPTYGPDPTGCCPGLPFPPFASAHRETLPFCTLMLCWGFNLSHQAASAFTLLKFRKSLLQCLQEGRREGTEDSG